MANGPGRLLVWLKRIDDVHLAAGVEPPSQALPVVELVARFRLTWRLIEAKAVAPASQQLGRVLDSLPTSLVGARDRAIILTGAVGALSFSDLIALRVADVDFIPGDGVYLSSRASDTCWLGSVDAGELCAPCALLWWLRRRADQNSNATHVDLLEAPDKHLCASPDFELNELSSTAPLFPRICAGGSVEFLDLDQVREIVADRFDAAGTKVRDVDGVRDELLVSREINEFTVS